MKAALYARVSTEEQAKNYSIENQIEAHKKYCKEHNYEIFKERIFETCTIEPANSKYNCQKDLATGSS